MKQFPNGFESWMETHHEVVRHLTETAHYSGSLANRAREEGGMGRLYELGESLTDEFEKLYEGKKWDGEFFDSVDLFLSGKEEQSHTY